MGNLTRCKIRVKMILLIMEFSTLLLSANGRKEPTDLFQKLSHVYRRVDDDTCQKPGCVRAAKAILESIDESVDPCDDFYRFSCGGFEKNAELHGNPNRISINLYTELMDKVDNQNRVMMEKDLTGTEPEHIRKLKLTYDTCMDEKSIEAAGGQPLKETLKALGGWPVVEGEGWDGQAFDWIDTVISMRQMGFSLSYLIDLQVKPDIRNTLANIIYLSSTNLVLHGKGLLLRMADDYHKLMVEVAIRMGADPQSASIEMREALNFEISLANISDLPYEDFGNTSMLDGIYTAKQLQEQVPQIDWMKYLNGVLMDPIPESEPLIISDPRFMKEFAKLISNTDKRVVANYLLWRAAAEVLWILSKELIALDPLQLYDKIWIAQRWEECVNDLWFLFDFALASYYVKNYFPKENKDRVLDIVTYIRQEFLNDLDSIAWMDEESKHHAREKALAMKPIFGYPDELLNDTLVSELYENLTITDGSYYENMIRIQKWNSEKKLLKLRKTHVFRDWKNHIIDVVYDQVDNSLHVPAESLQHKNFRKDRPQYMNFGTVGPGVGRMITRGFDDEGRQYDKEGHEVNWWSAETESRFEEKAKCFIEQYNNYTFSTGVKVNGVSKQRESIADNGAVKLAYRAYQSWVKEHKPEEKLPGLKYTPNQLFWISTASVFCGINRPEFIEAGGDVRRPHQFRVIGPISNSPEFSNDFNCAIGSPMNPQKKCEVW